MGWSRRHFWSWAGQHPRCRRRSLPARTWGLFTSAICGPADGARDPAEGTAAATADEAERAKADALSQAGGAQAQAEAKGREALLAPPYRVWTSLNDGADSGLDADALDGYTSGYFLDAIAAEALARKTGEDAEAAARVAADESLAARAASLEARAAALESRAASLEGVVRGGKFAGTSLDLRSSGPILARFRAVNPNDYWILTNTHSPGTASFDDPSEPGWAVRLGGLVDAMEIERQAPGSAVRQTMPSIDSGGNTRICGTAFFGPAGIKRSYSVSVSGGVSSMFSIPSCFVGQVSAHDTSFGSSLKMGHVGTDGNAFPNAQTATLATARWRTRPSPASRRASGASRGWARPRARTSRTSGCTGAELPRRR